MAYPGGRGLPNPLIINDLGVVGHWGHWLVTLCRVGHGSDVDGVLVGIPNCPNRTMQRRAFGRLDVNATFKKGKL